jgi:hypothetical protein
MCTVMNSDVKIREQYMRFWRSEGFAKGVVKGDGIFRRRTASVRHTT